VNKFKVALLISALSSFSTIAFAAAAPASPPAGAVSAVKSQAVKTQQSGDLSAPGNIEGSTPSAPAPPPAAPTLYGLAMPIVIHPDNPPRTHVYSGIIWYQPPKWIWNNLNVYIAGRYGHWWSDGAQVNRMINIYSLAPVLRYYFFKKTYFSPYLEASIGVGCLSRTHFNTRNLGMHFTFQDELGIGVVAGKEAGFYATVSVLHYSNAHLSSHNSGITVPVMLTLGYQFN
jgi:hypothetical protein